MLENKLKKLKLQYQRKIVVLKFHMSTLKKIKMENLKEIKKQKRLKKVLKRKLLTQLNMLHTIKLLELGYLIKPKLIRTQLILIQPKKVKK